MDTSTGKYLMDRRQLLITINGLAIGMLLPASTLSAERPSPKIGVVAVGRIGELIFDRDDNHVPASMRSIAIDTDADTLHRATANRKILVTRGSSVPSNPEAAVLHAKRTLIEISDAVAGLDLVILVLLCHKICYHNCSVYFDWKRDGHIAGVQSLRGSFI